MYFPIIKSIMKRFLSIGGAIMNELCTKIAERINTELRRGEWLRSTCVSCCAESWTAHPDVGEGQACGRSIPFDDGGTSFLRIQLIWINIWAVCLCKYVAHIMPSRLNSPKEFGLIEIRTCISKREGAMGRGEGAETEDSVRVKVTTRSLLLLLIFIIVISLDVSSSFTLRAATLCGMCFFFLESFLHLIQFITYSLFFHIKIISFYYIWF